MEMSCLTSSYFSSIDNGISPLTPTFKRLSFCKFVAHRFDFTFQPDLTHTQFVDPSIVTRNALFDQIGQLPLDRGPLANQAVFSKFQRAVRKDPGRSLGLGGDRLDKLDLPST